MKNISPAQMAQKWVDRLGAATANIREGVMAVTEAPGAKAAERKQAYIDGVMRSADKWAENTAAVSLQAWQQAMIKKGIPIIATRAADAKDKFTRFMTAWMGFQQMLQQELRGMPRGTLDQNIARAVHVMRSAKAWGQQPGNWRAR